MTFPCSNVSRALEDHNENGPCFHLKSSSCASSALHRCPALHLQCQGLHAPHPMQGLNDLVCDDVGKHNSSPTRHVLF